MGEGDLNVPFFENVLEKVKPFLLDVAEPLPLAGVTLWGTPPWVHFQVTLSPFLTLTVPGENELFFTETALVEPACAGTTATAAASEAATAATESLRCIRRTPSGWLNYRNGRARSPRYSPHGSRWSAHTAPGAGSAPAIR